MADDETTNEPSETTNEPSEATNEPSEAANEPSEAAILEQYRIVTRMVRTTNQRIDLLGYIYLALDLVLVLAFGAVVDAWRRLPSEVFGIVDLRLLPAFIPVTGMILSVVWVALSMRLQMAQRLYFFQLRQLEREMGLDRVGPFSSAIAYWDGEPVASRDGLETLKYPGNAEGRLARISHRVWIWLLPLWFFGVFVFLIIGWLINLRNYVLL
jgi:hypothetical protein